MNLESEWAVLVGIMRDNSLMAETDLNPDDFSDHAARQVFEVCAELIGNREAADVITVGEKLENTNHGHWLSKLMRISDHTVSVNARSYARSIKEAARKRKARAIAETLIERLNSDDADAVDNTIRDLMTINQSRKVYDCSIKQALIGAVNELERLTQTNGLPGLTTGLYDLDSALGGLHNTDLVIVAGRPAMGKTAFMLNLALATNEPVGIISTEQGRDQLGLRFMAIKGKVSLQAMRSNSMHDSEWGAVTRVSSELKERNLWLNDKPAPTINEVIRQARRWKFEKGIKALYVDYIQRIKAIGNAPKHEQIEDITQSLKELARELEIPVIALGQVNRQVETRPNKRPTMADLKGSGGIEQEADVVMTLYRDEVYDPNTDHKGMVEISVLKNRHGPILTVGAVWKGEFLRFENMANRDRMSGEA